MIVDLLRIVRVAMPLNLQAQDARLLAAERLVAALDAEAEEDDVSHGLALFPREDFAPATRAEAIADILRDWLVAHGYLPLAPPVEEQNQLLRSGPYLFYPPRHVPRVFHHD